MGPEETPDLARQNCSNIAAHCRTAPLNYPARARRLSEIIPVFIVVDADPQGVNIMLTYRHGSHEMSFEATSLAAPKSQWLGGSSHPQSLQY